MTSLESLWYHDYHSVVDPCRWREIYEKQQQRLGSAALALHYVNIITQIDTLVASHACFQKVNYYLQ